MRRVALFLGLAACAGLLLGGKPARAETFIADLSHHLIAITTAFSGTDVLLFGVADRDAGDVVTVVRGPPYDPVVRRKSRVGIVWLNTEEVQFEDVPGYYAMASSKPLDLIGLPRELRRLRIGFEHLPLQAADEEAHSAATVAEFREALIRNKQAEELYPSAVGTVRFVGDNLFRTTMFFPANVPPGTYTVEVFQFRDGRVVAAQQSALVITKIGMEAEIYDLSRQQPALYALISVGIALAAGWSAGLLFRK